MGVKANKARGHRAEIEAEEVVSKWPSRLQMVRTGLDGGHDLRGPTAIGEVKATMIGPAWLKSMLSQLDGAKGRDADKLKVGLLKLSKRVANRTGWLVIMDEAEFRRLLDDAAYNGADYRGMPAAPLASGSASRTFHPSPQPRGLRGDDGADL